jgi:hypothetical protein
LKVFESIRETLAFIKARPGPVLGFTLISAIPMILSQAAVSNGRPGLVFMFNLTFSIAYMVCMGAVAAATPDSDGNELDALQCLGMSFRRTPTYLLLMLIIFLCAIGLAIPLAILVPLASAAGSAASGVIGIVFLLGFAIALFFIYVSCSLTVPSMVLEELGAMQAVRRSLALTKGNRLKIFAVFLMIGVIATVFMTALAMSEMNSARNMTGSFLNPADLSAGYLAAVCANYFVFTAFLNSYLGIAYRTCTSIADSTRVNDFSEAF